MSVNKHFKYILENLKFLASKSEKENLKLFLKLKKRKQGLDELFGDAHTDIFSEINCLECANCCSSLGPRITTKDIERISGFLRLKQDDFVYKYLRIDEDNDYVFKNMPCPFLSSDNHCFIYEQRPKACREYPHTDSRKMHSLLQITLKNSYVCPAVFLIIEKIKEKNRNL